MKKIATIVTAVLLSLGLFAGPARADVQHGRDYDSLTLEQAIDALKAADAHIDLTLEQVTFWRTSNTEQWQRAMRAEDQLAQARRDATYFEDTARHWETTTRAAEAQVLRVTKQLRTAERRAARQERTIERLRARLAATR